MRTYLLARSDFYLHGHIEKERNKGQVAKFYYTFSQKKFYYTSDPQGVFLFCFVGEEEKTGKEERAICEVSKAVSLRSAHFVLQVLSASIYPFEALKKLKPFLGCVPILLLFFFLALLANVCISSRVKKKKKTKTLSKF